MKKLIPILQIIVLLYAQNIFAQTKADTIHVKHYDINLEIRDFAQQQLKGYTDVTVEAKITPLQNIYLHFLALTVDSVKKGENLVNFSQQGQQLKIDVSFLTIGQTETIRVYYHGKPAKDPQWGGFYFTSDFAYNMGVGMGSLPHSFGRVWFPCIDEFTDKSTYTFNITTDADKKAVCGGVLVDSTHVGNQKNWKWELTDPIPTYLASVAVGNYKVYKDTLNSVSGKILPIEIYADPATMQKVPGSFVNLKTFIHTYEKRWGACRWQRVGYVVVPFSGGAMEHATNIGYPQFAVNGNTNDQDLIAHELAHSWFGNLITCSTSHNMWINEGFATYGAFLCDEVLDPTLQTYNKGIRDLHMDVLKKTHNSDGGYFALDQVPTDITYGSTTYDKGGLVAYTLRNYMGDALFFSTIQQFFDENKYINVTSEEFFDKLSKISGINLHDFYLGWVHQPGFLNFNIDSIKPKEGSSNTYQVAFKQRLHHAEYYANNNLVDVEFISASGERYLKEKIRFSGEHDIVDVELPFEPAFWAIDPNFKMGDACYDFTKLLNTTGATLWSDGNFRIQVDEISGESILRLEHNFFAPTTGENNLSHLVRISETHFWRVGFLKYNEMQASYAFLFDRNNDGELINGYKKENLVLLYRKDAAHSWQIIPTTVSGSEDLGKLTANYLYSGEYTFGIIDNVKVNEYENKIEIYPNPVNDQLRIMNYELGIDAIKIYDMLGNEIIRKSQISNLKSIDVSYLPSGTYILEIISKDSKTYKKFIKL